MTSYSLKLSDVSKNWYLVDAKDLIVGRLSSRIALILRGKNKVNYTPSMDCGDNIIVINAELIKFTGKKLKNKKYYHHTGYPGGIKENTPKQILDKKPQEVLRKAVRGMLGKGPLGRQQMKSLYVYAGSEHPHTAQKPQILDIKSLNSKNSILLW